MHLKAKKILEYHTFSIMNISFINKCTYPVLISLEDCLTKDRQHLDTCIEIPAMLKTDTPITIVPKEKHFTINIGNSKKNILVQSDNHFTVNGLPPQKQGVFILVDAGKEYFRYIQLLNRSDIVPTYKNHVVYVHEFIEQCF